MIIIFMNILKKKHRHLHFRMFKYLYNNILLICRNNNIISFAHGVFLIHRNKINKHIGKRRNNNYFAKTNNFKTLNNNNKAIRVKTH